MLQDIYLKYGYSSEKMKSIVRKGKAGAEEIEQLMVNFRNHPPKMLAGSLLERVKDYETLVEKNLITGEIKRINQKSTSNVLQFFTVDGTKVSVRPSGTEPKIKFYIEVKAPLATREKFDQVETETFHKVELVMNDLAI
jgi:phosphoglucomutase